MSMRLIFGVASVLGASLLFAIQNLQNQHGPQQERMLQITTPAAAAAALIEPIAQPPKLPLRGLFFGTSRTYGTGMEDRIHLVYPYQLTDNVTNLAIRGTGPVSHELSHE